MASQPSAPTSSRTCGARCTASTNTRAPASWASFAIAATSGIVPSRFDAPVTATQRVRSSSRAPMLSGSSWPVPRSKSARTSSAPRSAAAERHVLTLASWSSRVPTMRSPGCQSAVIERAERERHRGHVRSEPHARCRCTEEAGGDLARRREQLVGSRGSRRTSRRSSRCRRSPPNPAWRRSRSRASGCPRGRRSGPNPTCAPGNCKRSRGRVRSHHSSTVGRRRCCFSLPCTRLRSTCVRCDERVGAVGRRARCSRRAAASRRCRRSSASSRLRVCERVSAATTRMLGPISSRSRVRIHRGRLGELAMSNTNSTRACSTCSRAGRPGRRNR